MACFDQYQATEVTMWLLGISLTASGLAASEAWAALTNPLERKAWDSAVHCNHSSWDTTEMSEALFGSSISVSCPSQHHQEQRSAVLAKPQCVLGWWRKGQWRVSRRVQLVFASSPFSPGSPDKGSQGPSLNRPLLTDLSAAVTGPFGSLTCSYPGFPWAGQAQRSQDLPHSVHMATPSPPLGSCLRATLLRPSCSPSQST